MDWLVQLLGLIGWIFYLISYWKKDLNSIILFQIFSGIFYAIHYYFLGANMGLFIIFFDLIRDILYYKTNIDKYIFVTILPVYIFAFFKFYSGLFSILPIFPSIIDGFGLAFKKSTAILSGIFSATCWVIYDFFAGSYVCVITGIIMIFSNIYVYFRDRKLAK